MKFSRSANSRAIFSMVHSIEPSMPSPSQRSSRFSLPSQRVEGSDYSHAASRPVSRTFLVFGLLTVCWCLGWCFAGGVR